jgi:hypothetical protein
MKNSDKENLSSADFGKRLASACEGLIYISETDAPIEPFFAGKTKRVTAEALQKTGVEAPIEEASFDQFFERLTRKREWHGEAEKRSVRKFAKLEKLLKENLHDLKVFRFGRVRIDIYVVGIDAEGNLAGVKTKAVET